jgi:RimJ/RimL family protein N-acetyltransferase
MPFDLQPTLQGELISLRPLEPDDFDAVFAVASDPQIWEQHPAWDRYKPEVFKKLFDESLASGGCLVVLDANDGKVIGWSRYHGYNEAKGEIEIGWTFLAREYWGGVYNREMKELMMAHAFKFVESCIFVIGTQNRRSQKAIEKLGAVREGVTANASGSESYVYRIQAPLQD